MALGWTKRYKKRFRCPCGPHEAANTAKRRCCEAAVVDGEHAVPQGFYLSTSCNYNRLPNGTNDGHPNAACGDPDATKEKVLPQIVALNKECVRGCRYVSRRDSASDPDSPCCDNDNFINGPMYLDTEEGELSCVGWVLEVTSPTSAVLTYSFRNGNVATYVSPDPWNPLKPANFQVTSSLCHTRPLPPQLCVYPQAVADGFRGCRTANNTCDCCDDYQCTGAIRVVVNCPEGTEPVVYDGEVVRWQWEDDFPEGFPNGLNGNMFRCGSGELVGGGLLPTTDPFAGFDPIFADFPANYANAPCGVWIGSVGPFSAMIACVGDDTYHFRLTCVDPDTSAQTIVIDQQYTSQCTCSGWEFSFNFDDAPCVECPGGGGHEVPCCPGVSIPGRLTISDGATSVDLDFEDSGVPGSTPQWAYNTDGSLPTIFFAGCNIQKIQVLCEEGMGWLSQGQPESGSSEPTQIYGVAPVSCDPFLLETAPKSDTCNGLTYTITVTP